MASINEMNRSNNALGSDFVPSTQLKSARLELDKNNNCINGGKKDGREEVEFRTEIVWKNAVGFAVMHAMAAYGVYVTLTDTSFATILWSFIMGYLCQVGIGVGAHRLFTHRSFEAAPSLKLFLIVCQTISGQNCLYIWVRDHRQHHKYTDTNADPHNSTRGFFFSHIGWLMCRKHPDVIKYGKTIDMSDLEADPYVMFQKKYYKPLYVVFALIFPISVPCYFWGESLVTSFFTAYMLRYVVVLNVTWLVNSAAHMYGMRPYDKNIRPVETAIVSYFTGGEGWHNFHHCFPWDYRAAEYGSRFNTSEEFIDFCARHGLARNLRKVSSNHMVKSRVLKSGDGSHHLWGTAAHAADGAGNAEE